LSEHAIDSNIFNIWNSVIMESALSQNWQTPFHYVQPVPWYDIICTLGGDDDTVLERTRTQDVVVILLRYDHSIDRWISLPWCVSMSGE